MNVNTNSHESRNNHIPNTFWYLVYICLFISCIWLFNSPILINRIKASIKLLLPNIHTYIITWYQSVQDQQKSERSTAPKTTTKEIIISNSKFISQTKENQSWPQSKTQTWLLIQYPPPQQYPDPSELTD